LQQRTDHDKTDVEQNEPGKDLEMGWIGKILDPQDNSDQDAGYGPGDNHPGQGPDHTTFTDKTVDPAGYGNDIEQMVGGADRRSDKAQYAHLKRQQQVGAGHAAH
jgi:hypothetical protein